MRHVACTARGARNVHRRRRPGRPGLPARAHTMPGLMLALVVLFVCCAAPQVVSAGQGPRSAPAPVTHHRAEESVCCGSLDDPVRPVPIRRPGPRQCCGKGWGLHCCLGGFCCLDDGVVPSPSPVHPPTPALPVQGKKETAYSLRDGDDFWQWKNWAQWLNLGVVILVVALVCAVLACCWRRERRDKALRHQRLLRLGDDIYSYGTVTGPRPTAPYWNPPMASRWMDFSHRPAMGTALKPHASPYRPAPAPTVREAVSSDSDIDIRPPLVFSSSDEEHRLVAEFKRKTKITG